MLLGPAPALRVRNALWAPPFFPVVLPPAALDRDQMDEADWSQHPMGYLCLLLTRSCWEENVQLDSEIFLQSAEGKNGTRGWNWNVQGWGSGLSKKMLMPGNLWLPYGQILHRFCPGWRESGTLTHSPSWACVRDCWILCWLAWLPELTSLAPSALDLYLPFWIIFYFFIPTPLPKKPYFC